MADLRKLRWWSFGLFLFTFCILIVAFGSTYWYNRTDIYGYRVNHGLWRLCDTYFVLDRDDICVTFVGSHLNENGKLRSVQTFACISLILSVVALPLYIAWVSRSDMRLGVIRAFKVGTAALSLCLASGVSMLITVGLFGINYIDYEEILNWGFVLAIISATFHVANGMTCLIILRVKIGQPKDAPTVTTSRARPQPPPLITAASLPPLPAKTATKRPDNISAEVTGSCSDSQDWYSSSEMSHNSHPLMHGRGEYDHINTVA